jgi:peptidoglycan/LPS O-acetylase OafA/YrhL
MRVTRNVTWSPRDPMVVLGRTPMFFYLLHIPLLWLMAKLSGLGHQLGLGATYSFAALAAVLLYPLCIYYGGYRARNPNGIARYV